MGKRRCISLFLVLGLASFCHAQAITSYTTDTVAGTYPLGDHGPAVEAFLGSPDAVAASADGRLFIADSGSYRVRDVSQDGTINTLFSRSTHSLCLADTGELYLGLRGEVVVVTDRDKHRRIVGGGNFGYGGDGGPATRAGLGVIRGIAKGANGTLYLSDSAFHVLRQVTPDGIIRTIAGSGGTSGFAGDGGPASEALLSSPGKLAMDALGNLYVADRDNLRVRKIAADGTITTVAGNGLYGRPQPGATATASPLGRVSGIAIDDSGSIYFTDPDFHRVLRVDPDGTLRRVVGADRSGFSGDGGPAELARLNGPLDVALNGPGTIYIADSLNDRIRAVSPDGMIRTVAGQGRFGGDGGAARLALLNRPNHVAIDSRTTTTPSTLSVASSGIVRAAMPEGTLYISDSANHRIRRVMSDGVINTIAGTGVPGFSGDGGAATDADLELPGALALDAGGDLYFADTANHRVRQIGAGGAIRSIAGNGATEDIGDGGPATEAGFRSIRGLAFHSDGSLLVSDCGANRIRKISGGVITALAGTGEPGFSGDGGPALEAEMHCPGSIVVSATGTVFFADSGNSRIRRIAADGTISTVAGGGSGYPSDDNLAVSSNLAEPFGLALDAEGNLYVTTRDIDRQEWVRTTVHKITAQGTIWTILGGSVDDYDYDIGGPGSGGQVHSLNRAEGIAVDALGNVYVADKLNHRVRRLSPVVPVQIEMVDGNEQTGLIGFSVPAPLRVKVSDGGGVGIMGVAVRYSVTSGAADLKYHLAMTRSDGIAGMGVKALGSVGDIIVTATVEGLPSIDFLLHGEDDPGLLPPTISPNSVFGSGWSSPQVRAISQGGLVTVYGQWFAPLFHRRGVLPGDLVDGMLPTVIDNVCVLVDDRPAYFLYLSDRQLNVQVPALPGVTSAEVRVVRGCGTSNEISSPPAVVPAWPATPEFFYWHRRNDTGIFPINAVNPITGVRVGRRGLIDGLEFVPARPGDLVDLYGTGFGVTEPYFPPGVLPDEPAETVLRPQVTFGERRLSDEDILYCGATQWAGVYILRIRVPDDTPPGDHSVKVRLGDHDSPPGGFLAVDN